MRRRESGYALVSTMVIGLFAILFLMGLSGYVMSDMQSEARRKQKAILTNAAEAGLDYAIHKFNTEYPCTLDPISGNSLESDLPPGYLQASYGSVTNNATNVTVKIVVKKLTDTDWALLQNFTTIYNPQLDLANNLTNTSAPTPSGVPPSNNLTFESDYWRVIESKATAAGRTRTFRSILMPTLQSSAYQAVAPSNSSPLFEYGLFGNSNLSVGNTGVRILSSETDPITPDTVNGNKYKLRLATNRSASIGAGAEVQGDVEVKSNFSNTATQVIENNGLIDGRVSVNQAVAESVNFTNSSTTTMTGDNVLANADDGIGTNRKGANMNPVTEQANSTPFGVNPSFGGGDNAQPLAPLSAVSASEAPITGGDYQTYGLSTQNMTSTSPQIQFSGSDPVRIFVKDSPLSTEAVNVDASMIAAPANALNLQIYYSGTKPVNVKVGDGQTFRGLIYAPLATVTTTGTGNGTFDGAIVGNQVSINHSGSMIVHTDLNQSTQSGPKGLYRETPADSSASPLDLGWRWKPVTWEEVQP